MSSITIDTDDELIGKKSKNQRYKQIVDSQARQKLAYSLFRKRNNTTNERSSLSFSQKNNEAFAGERRLRQQSTFLPSLANKVLRVKKSHQRSYTYGHQNESDDNSFQADAIDYLRDCETILENLKRLTKNSTQKISSPIVSNKMKGGLSIKSSLRIQQQKNLLRSPEINQNISNRLIKNGRNQKENDQSDHSDHSDCDLSDRLGDVEMKKIWRKSNEVLKQDQRLIGKTNGNLLTDNNQNNEEQIKQFGKQKSVISLKNDKNKIGSTTIFVSFDKDQKDGLIKGINKTQNINMKEHSVSKSKQNKNHSSYDSNFTPQISYQQQAHQNLKHEQSKQIQVSKQNNIIETSVSNLQNKKQKFLLKFLNNANTRGMELHKKIMEHRLKNRAFIHSVANKCGKSKELIENIRKEQNKKSTQLSQNECQGKENKQNKLEKSSDDGKQDCKDDGSDIDGSEESQLSMEQLKNKKYQIHRKI